MPLRPDRLASELDRTRLLSFALAGGNVTAKDELNQLADEPQLGVLREFTQLDAAGPKRVQTLFGAMLGGLGKGLGF